MTMRMMALALSLTAVAATAAAAQAAPAPGAPPAGERGARGEHGKDGRGWGGRGERRRLFRGVNLTDAQRTQLRAIRDKYAAEQRPLRESMRPAMQEARQARQRGDTAAARAAFARTAETRTRMRALRDRQMAEVRAILTPEQQRTFDANLASAKQRHDERRAKMEARRKG
ncbi:MAG TPA: Spy/CpxP family protein refolding chaperone [Gemmatimonadaceae bacterium]|nr:Spy/CpxP family protein refolding chaperone [Gemmatimonadaceae bacterium]